MQIVGQSWLVLELTNSALALGMVFSFQYLPTLLFSIFAGPVVDKLPKRRMLQITQLGFIFISLTLAIVTLTHTISYILLLMLSILTGLVNTVDVPTRQSYFVELCGKERLVNAISLNSVAFNLARMTGSALGGVLVATAGVAVCFFINCISYCVVLVSLSYIKSSNNKGSMFGLKGGLELKSYLASTKEGLRYVFLRPPIFVSLGLLAIISCLLINYNIITATFARVELGYANTTSGAGIFGLLLASLGVGSLFGALLLAIKSQIPTKRKLFIHAISLCLTFIVLGLQKNLYLSLFLFCLAGFFTITLTASINAHVQVTADNPHRGRVMSLYAMVFQGTTPIGALISGALIAMLMPGSAMIVLGFMALILCVTLLLVSNKSWKNSIESEKEDAK